jgi:NADPH-dependent 2,4-dienoyl-CoA reductase/sulfur reductase-like enzyme
VIEVVVVGAGPNGLMLACELGLAGSRPVVLDPMPGPSPQARANHIGRPVGEVPATGVLVRPDGYVAWASPQARIDPDELRELRGVLTHWFGI